MSPKDRRAKGTGSIYQREDGTWIGVVELPSVMGKRNRRTVQAATQREAKRRRNELAARLAREAANGPAPERLTVAELLDRWLAVTVGPHLAAKTYQGYYDLCRHYLRPRLGAVQLDALTAYQIDACYHELASAGYSASTIHDAHRCLKTALGQAVRWGLIAQSPMAGVRVPRATRRPMQPLSPAEAKRLLDQTADDDLGPLWTLAITTGMRQGELLGLGWSDVDLVRGQLTVGRTLQYQPGNGLVLKPGGKTPAARRTIVLTERAVSALNDQRARLMEARNRLGPDWSEMGLVFPSPTGTPRDPSAVRHNLTRTLARLGLPRVTFHDLRHTAATLMLTEAKIPLFTVSRILGHATIGVTADVYGHLSTDAQASAAEALNGLFRAGS